MSERVALVSLGCPKNLVDSEVMVGFLRRAGYEVTARLDHTCAVVVNTCAFIDDAQEEAIDTILELAQMKASGRLRALVVAGCLAQRYGARLMSEIPEIDAVVGTGDFPGIASVVRSALAREKVVLVGEPPRFLYDDATPRVPSTPPYMAYLKIAEGCSNRCSYCVIPQLRGALRSRSMDSVVREAVALAASGVRELVLVAQDTTRYGEDLYGRLALADLLRELSRVSGLAWIRVMYMHPARVTPELVEVMAGEPRICRYVDLPLQHASDEILRAMNRGYTSDDARRVISMFRAAMPDVTIRTTFMVGFPGETEDEFRTLLDFMSEVRFDRAGVFAYSPQDGTPAAQLPGQIPAAERARRRARAMELQRGISREVNRAKIGRELDVLVLGPSEESELVTVARSQAEAPEVDGLVYMGNERPPPGTFRRVRVIDAGDYDLVVEVLPITNAAAEPSGES